MQICVVNPNTTASMTRKIGSAAAAVAAKGTNIITVNPSFGPPSIEGYFDEAFSVPGLIEEISNAPDADAYIVACFDDTGLDTARCITDAPVIGIGEAAFHMATLIAGQFSVVTTLSRSIPAIEGNLVRYGLRTRCAKVRASDVPVLELEAPGSNARHRISDEISAAIRDDRAEAIVLGCAGMTDLASSLWQEHGIPVLDGVTCAVKLCEGLVALGLKTSKVGGYAMPRAKTYSGLFARFSPSGTDTLTGDDDPPERGSEDT
ncbi:aspartate/glutamate racemase family protein [Microvirga calopogonii]|uniref:aspartate/glutamate racemase family protein n=1 Tax=Microvirga calopogonii TaxID=2078013 RepID=UPI000E0CC897|nr:aspartate/glutamate racemase family protein [Microvirga calopogonii]